MRLAIPALGLLAITLLPAKGLTQQWPEVGERVRVRHVDGRMFTGSVESAVDEELRLGGPGGPYVMVRADITGMERSLGEHRSFGRAFATTIGVTAGGGGLIGAVAWSPCTDGCILHPQSRTDAFAWGVVAGAVVGFPIAILVGAASKSERWEPIPAFGPVVLSAVAGPAGGVDLRASLSVDH